MTAQADTFQVTSTLSPGARRGRWRAMRLLINLGECHPDIIDNQDELYAYVEQLVDRINMVAYGEPLIEYFGKNDPDLAGNTVVQLIETSNVDVHAFDSDGCTLIHICSCRRFHPGAAIAFTAEYFRTDLYEATAIDCYAPERITP